MIIQQLTQKIVEAVKTREKYHCDSPEYEQADEKVNDLLLQVRSEDNKEFNRLYNQSENWN